MNKFSKYFAAFASLAVLASCSNDEPGNGGGENKPVEGESAYINVAIRDANGGSRAGEGPFENGTEVEGKVSDAYFFFFDAEKNYVGQATIWDAPDTPNQTTGGNIELKGNSVVVLDNLKGNQYPKYMVTVLNCEGFEKLSEDYLSKPANAMTLEKFSQTISKWGENKAGKFMMSTTSYLAENSDNYEFANYYATVLHEDNFARTPELAAQNTAVEVYVERLAARVKLASNKIFQIHTTVAGMGNSEVDAPETDIPVASTELYVRIDGWGLNGIQETSYLSKQLGDWKTATKFGNTTWEWNHPTLYRSFWGQGINYGKLYNADVTKVPLKYFTYEQLTKNAGDVDYCNENTTTNGDLAATGSNLPNQQLLTSVIVKATVCSDKDGNNTIDLVEHNGLYFTKVSFLKYILNVNNNAGHEFFTRTETSTEGAYEYNGITEKDLDWDGNNKKIYVKYTGNQQLYVKDDAVEGGYKTISTTDVQNYLKAASKFNSENVRTRAFKGGQMYYNIPVAHLNDKTYDTNGDLTTWVEASFGVVRNHAYNVTINSVKRLGQGVFDPSHDVIVPDPDPKDPNWYLGATVNVLAWKIVTNNVDL